jgi:hypothetical protein
MSRTLLAIITGLFFIFLHSCSALSDSQKTIIQEFATSGKTYSDAPKALLTTYGKCLYQKSQIQAANSKDTATMLNRLDEASKKYFSDINYSEELNLSYQLLSQYFQVLTDFVNVDTASEFKANATSLGTNIDSLGAKMNTDYSLKLPIGFGTIAGTAVKYAGSKVISHKELVYFQKFVERGDALVDSLSIVMRRIILGSLLEGELKTGDKNLREDYRLYLTSIDPADKKNSALYKDLNPIYLSVKTCYGQAMLLAEKLGKATDQLVAAHKDLVKVVYTKKGKELTARDVAAFVQTVSEINNLISQFKSSN